MSGLRVYKHVNYAGSSAYWTHPLDSRYYRVSRTALSAVGLHDAISSLRFFSAKAERVTSILFQHAGLEGRFVAYQGIAPSHDIPSLSPQDFNDRTSSILLVRHADREFFPIGFASTARQDATSAVDAALADAPASRRGPLVFTWEMWPDFDPDKKFVELRIPITVDVPNWWDYDAEITYYIYFYIDGQGRLQGYVNWVRTWVEGGIMSGSIIDRLHPEAMNAAATVNAEIRDLVTELDFYTWQSLYYMPGVTPLALPGDYSGHVEDDVTMVLVRA